MKYHIEVQTEPRAGFRPLANFDEIFTTRAEAEACAMRARRLWYAARVVAIEVPATCDHLYQRLGGAADTTYMFAR